MRQQHNTHTDIDRDDVLAEATLNAAAELGLTQEQLAAVLGRTKSRLRAAIRVDNRAGECALLVVRIYRSLYALLDGNPEHMQHWMANYNHGTGGIPSEQVQHIMGLAEVVNYLDAIRGKV
jgi:hypothetical protein